MAASKELLYVNERIAELRRQIAPLQTEVAVMLAARRVLYREYVLGELYESGVKLDETVCMLVNDGIDKKVLVCGVDSEGFVIVRAFTKKGVPFKGVWHVAHDALRTLHFGNTYKGKVA